MQRKIRPDKEIEKDILRELNNLPEETKKTIVVSNPLYVYKPHGCPKCNMKGEKGRVGIFEVLKMTSDLEKIIIESPTEDKIGQEGKRQGMITMRQDAILKALQGIISVEEVFRISEEQ